MSSPTIVFDLDGTLIDTAPDLVATLNVILIREGLSPLAYETARNLVGGGAKAMIARGLEAEGRPCSPPRLEQLFADFIAHYSDHLTERSQPFPGVTDALDALSERGYQFAVCTNKIERLSTNLLKHHDLAERFITICGPDTFGIEKPDPEILRRTVMRAGGTLKQAIMIGDSIVDIHTARAAGIPVIAVDFGYSKRPVADFGPDRTISSFAQLPMSVAALAQNI
jgi:phosphoglycolate phosphatase